MDSLRTGLTQPSNHLSHSQSMIGELLSLYMIKQVSLPIPYPLVKLHLRESEYAIPRTITKAVLVYGEKKDTDDCSPLPPTSYPAIAYPASAASVAPVPPLPSFFLRLRLEASAFWHHLNIRHHLLDKILFVLLPGSRAKEKGKRCAKGHLINIRILWGLQVLMHPSQILLLLVKPYDVWNWLREGASLQRKGIALVPLAIKGLALGIVWIDFTLV